MSLDTAAWAEISRLWRESDERLGQIAARFGIPHQLITARARRERWPLRKVQAGKPDSAQGEQTAGHCGEMRLGEASETDAARNPERDHRERAGGAVLPGSPRNRERAKSRRAIVERLFDAMDTKLSAIERRILEGGDATPADSERTTRSLNTLVRSLEKLADYEGKIGKQAGRKNGKRRTVADDPERRRQELARRIQQLLDR